MHASVRDFFVPFSVHFEARVHLMYLDVKGKVTTGIGNLIDSPEEAQRLPWVDKTTRAAADADTIAAEWRAVKARQDLSHTWYTAFDPITQLRLNDVDIDAHVMAVCLDNERQLRTHTPEFAAWDTWPADAQLGVLSIAWAQGYDFSGWTHFRAAAAAGRWVDAADQSHLADAGNPGLTPRNEANRVLFNNADIVVDNGWDASELLYRLP